MFTLLEWAAVGFGLAWLASSLLECFEPHASTDLSGSERAVACVVLGFLWACVGALVVGFFVGLGLMWTVQ